MSVAQHMTVEGFESGRASLLAALAEVSGPEVVVDLEGVESLDVVGLQVLASLAKWAESRGKTVAYANASSEVHEVAEVLGLAWREEGGAP